MDKDKKTTIVIPRELWRRARVRAAEEDTGFGTVVIRALESYLAAKTPKKERRR
jgi:hypothetical protein